MGILRPWAHRLALASGLAALGAPHPAGAQTIPSSYRFIDGRQDAGLFFGYMQAHRGELDIGPGGGPVIGGRYSIELSGPIAAELSGYAIPTDRKVFDVQPGTGRVFLGTTDLLVIAVDARLRFTFTGPRTWHGLAPFILAGGGVVGSLASPSPLEEGIGAADRLDFGPGTLLVTGGGFRWIPWSRLTFRADATLHLWRIATPPGYVQIADDLGPYPEKDWVSMGAALFGLSYRF
jgi:hypothetical protein